MLRRLVERLQLDRTLGYALATRAWQAISGPVTVVLLIRSLTLPEQGVYYALVGIVGIQAYFELGLSNVLVSQAGHAAAAGHQASARLRGLSRAAFRWFLGGSALFAISAIVFGWIVLDRSQVAWQAPLLALVPTAALSVWLIPGLSILEGAGHRHAIYRLRFVQAFLGSVVVWTALLAGWKLWALVAASAVQAAIGLYVTFFAGASFFSELRGAASERSNFDWFREVMPVQWRVALISLTFHFATQFFAIIVLTFHGDAEAGPLGMTLSVTTAIQALAFAWVQTKYPVVSSLHASGEREAAGTLWRRTAAISSGILVAAIVGFGALLAALPAFDLGIEKRFVAPTQLLAIGLGALATHVASLQGFYVLSRRAKPLLAASLAGSLSMAAAVWIGGYFLSTDGVVWGYALAGTLVLVPCHTIAYLQFRRRTEMSAAEASPREDEEP